MYYSQRVVIQLNIKNITHFTFQMTTYIKEAIEQGRVTGIYALQTLFSAIANSGDWNGLDIIPDDFYKELKVNIRLQ